MPNSDDNNTGARAFGPAAECLDIEDLQPTLDGRRGEEARRSTEAHLSSCAHCRAELSLLRDFDTAAPRPEERRDVSWIVARLRRPAGEAPWWKRPWSMRILVSAVAAAAVIALAAGLHMRRSVVEPVSYSPGVDAMRSQAVSVLSPVGDVDKAPRELRWRAVASAAQYRVRVLEVDRAPLWTSATTATQAYLPEPLRRNIVPLRTLLWDVVALDAAGNVLADSGLQRFRLTVTAAP